MQITKEVMEWILFIVGGMGVVCALVIANDLFKPESWRVPCKKIKRKRW